MKWLRLQVLILVLTLSSLALANEEKALEQYYLQRLTGEHQIANYSGPLNPLSRFDSENGRLVFLDDVLKESFLHNQLERELFELKDFWFNELNDQSACPNTVLAQNLDYIRYLYRLTTISYLFESLKIHHRVTTQLSGDKKFCSLSYDELFGKCEPKSSDMKKFKERVYAKFVNDISKISYEPLFKSEINGWLTLFKRSTDETLDPTFSRLHHWCKSSEKNCNKLTLPEIKDAVASFCEEDRQLIQTICNEKDNLYGMTSVEKSSELIKKSNAFNLINSNGMGENCLRRFGKIFSSKESVSRSLTQLYPTIYAYLLKENSRYTQGELFLPGALKEFDMKGLNDFLSALKPPVVVAEAPKPAPKPKALPEKKIEVGKVEAKPVEVKPEPAPPVVVQVPEVHISEFERALEEIQKTKLDRRALDMDVFQTDFEFTTKMISELAIPLRKFQTRKALLEMKTFDKLGDKEAPLGLIFIKFLIDTENHQGLHNVVAILSNKFYVHNDLEDKDVPVFIELKNDSTTKNKWQITLLGSQKNSETLK